MGVGLGARVEGEQIPAGECTPCRLSYTQKIIKRMLKRFKHATKDLHTAKKQQYFL